MNRKKEVDDAAFGARVFYFIFHFLGFLIMLYYDCEISRDLKEFKLIPPLLLLAIFLISAYLFMTCGDNPGYAYPSPKSSFQSISDNQMNYPLNAKFTEPINDQPYYKNQRTERLSSEQIKGDSEEQQMDFLSNEKNSGSERQIVNLELRDLKLSKKNNSDTKILLDSSANKMDQQYNDELKNINQLQQQEQIEVNIDRQEQQYQKEQERQEEEQQEEQNQEYEQVKRFFCPKCNLRQKYRTRHCDLCGICIHKYDHHCFWIGGCVGELNHRTFFLFLVFQCIFVSWAFKVFWYGMDNYSQKDPSTGEWKHGNAYGAFAVFAFISFCFILFTGILALYHSFLIMTNQSTWEHASRNKITYTQIYPKGFYPFDKGIWNNIKMIFAHGGVIQEWKLPNLKEAQFQAQSSFNICENQYYSCC